MIDHFAEFGSKQISSIILLSDHFAEMLLYSNLKEECVFTRFLIPSIDAVFRWAKPVGK